jgi:hypothetical protein
MGGIVADQNNRSRQVATVPSSAFGGDPELDIDAAMQRLNQSRQAAAQTRAAAQHNDELDLDDDDTTEAGTHTDDEPEDDDFEDDDDVDEVNTPTDDDEDEDEDTSLESTDTRRKSTGTPPDARKGKTLAPDSEEDEEDDVPKLSRKQRGKLIEELRQQVLQTEQEKARLAAQQRAQQEEDERLAKEVQKALGSEEEYERAMEEGLQGDETQAERARIWKSNRAFFNKLVKQAERRVQTNFTNAYWGTVKELPGIDMNVMQNAPLAEVIRHIHEAGSTSIEGAAEKRIEALEEEVETWKGRYRSLKAKAGGSKRSPVGSGGEPVSAKKQVDWRRKYLGKDGLPTDEADVLVQQGGIEALLQPSKRVR